MIKLVLAASLVLLAAGPAPALQTVALSSKSPLVTIKVMVKAGSAQDPKGYEGLAMLTASLLVDGGYGDPQAPVTKEMLAELTRPWGTGAMPGFTLSKEATTFSFLVPREAASEYLDKVLVPLLTRPLFSAKELERVKAERLQSLRSDLRLEQIEALGHAALDAYIHDGTPYAHPDLGTEKGLALAERYALLRFYRTHYRPDNVIVGLSSPDKALSAKLEAALASIGRAEAGPFEARPSNPPAPLSGRQALIVSLPNAISSGLHAGFPIALTRRDPDFWPLYVANVWFGAHRDGFSHLYEEIREKRGYNYGDYSYIEHFEGRPYNLFPPFNTPRRHQYFSVWVRPVQHAFVPHLAKAVVWELEHLVRDGLTEEQCALAKNKARVLYLSLAETADRLLASALDDAFYGLEPGYLPGYLDRVDAVTCEQVNAAVRRHLQAKDLKLLVVTHASEAAKLAAALTRPGPAWGKAPTDYQIDAKEEDGRKLFLVPEPKLEILQRDALWADTPLALEPKDVRIVPVEKLFETAALPR